MSARHTRLDRARSGGGAWLAAVIVAASGFLACCSRPTAPPVQPEDASASASASADASADANANANVAGDGGTDTTSAEAGASVEAGATRARSVKIDEGSEGKTIELAPGQSLVAHLAANPTTGFDWAVIKAPPALGPAEMSFVTGGDQPGAPGKRRITWTLKTALPAGEHPVELGYARSFEKGVAPFKSFKFKVRAAH